MDDLDGALGSAIEPVIWAEIGELESRQLNRLAKDLERLRPAELADALASILDGLSAAEIAEALGYSPSNYFSHLALGRDRLVIDLRLRALDRTLAR